MFGREKIYNVYLNPADNNPLESAIFIEDGFSFMAFLFNGLWAIYYRVWGLLAACLIIGTIIELVALRTGMGSEAMGILSVLFYIWVGFEACDWYGAALEKRGYVFYEIISATYSLEAKLRFFDKYLNSKNKAVKSLSIEGNSASPHPA